MKIQHGQKRKKTNSDSGQRTVDKAAPQRRPGKETTWLVSRWESQTRPQFIHAAAFALSHRDKDIKTETGEASDQTRTSFTQSRLKLQKKKNVWKIEEIWELEWFLLCFLLSKCKVTAFQKHLVYPHCPSPPSHYFPSYTPWASQGALVVNNLSAHAGDTRELDPWVGNIPWRRKWQPSPLFLPGKFRSQKRLKAIVQGGRGEGPKSRTQLSYWAQAGECHTRAHAQKPNLIEEGCEICSGSPFSPMCHKRLWEIPRCSKLVQKGNLRCWF